MSTTLFDYTNQAPESSLGVSNQRWFAQSFTSNSVYNLENIKLYLFAYNPVPVTIRLYNSGLNSIIATSNPTDVSSNGIYSFTFANTVQIQASTYNIVLGQNDLEWFIDANSQISFPAKKSINQGLSWIGQTQKMLFGVVVSVPISISSNIINENAGANAVVGTFSTIESDASNNFTYSLVGGTGDTDNASFEISGNQLRATTSFDFETKSSYSIRVRSTDQGGLTREKQFTITVNDVNDVVETISANITNGKVTSSILPLDSNTVFNFTDPSFYSTTPTRIFGGTGSALPLIGFTGMNFQINVTEYPSNYKFVYSPFSTATKISIPALNGFNFGFVLKVVDLSGNVISSIPSNTINLEFLLDKTAFSDYSSKNRITLFVNGDMSKGAGAFIKTTDTSNNYVYRGSLVRGDGGYGAIGGSVNASSGSDPHITTLSGVKYDFHPTSRRNYTLYKSKDVKVSSHFTGYKSGFFYDKVMIDLPNKEKVEVDFGKQRIKGKSSFVSVAEESIPVTYKKYKNINESKHSGKEFQPNSLTKLSVQGKNPVDMYIDYQTRYVHFRFPDTVPSPEEMSGLIVEPATRLD
jgi:hypothetical protein